MASSPARSQLAKQEYTALLDAIDPHYRLLLSAPTSDQVTDSC